MSQSRMLANTETVSDGDRSMKAMSADPFVPPLATTPQLVLLAADLHATPEPVGVALDELAQAAAGALPPKGTSIPKAFIDGFPAHVEELPLATEPWAPDWFVKRVKLSADLGPNTGDATARTVLLEFWARPSLPWIPGTAFNTRNDGVSLTLEIPGILLPTMIHPGAGIPLMLGADAAYTPTPIVPPVAHDVYLGGLRGPDQAYVASPGSPRNCFNPKFLAALSPETLNTPQGLQNLAAWVRYVGFQTRRRYQHAPGKASISTLSGSFDLCAFHSDQSVSWISQLNLPSIAQSKITPAIEKALERIGLPRSISRTVPGAKYWPAESITIVDPKTGASPHQQSIQAMASTHFEIGELLGGWFVTRHPMAYDQARRAVFTHAFWTWDVGILAGGGFDFGDNTRNKARAIEGIARMAIAAKIAGDVDTFIICEWLLEIFCERVLDLWDLNPAQFPPTKKADILHPGDLPAGATPWITPSGSTGSLDDRHLLVPNDCAYFIFLLAFASGLASNVTSPGTKAHAKAVKLRDRTLEFIEQKLWIPGTATTPPIWILDLPADGNLELANVYAASGVGAGTFEWIIYGFQAAGRIGSPCYLAACEAIVKKTGKPVAQLGAWAF